MTALQCPTLPKSRPILFSGDMVRSRRRRLKTQTRRLVKSNLPDGIVIDPEYGAMQDEDGYWVWFTNRGQYNLGKCPYGDVGDRLWVRETHYAYGYWIYADVADTWHFVRALQVPVRFFNDSPAMPTALGDLRIEVKRRAGHHGWWKRPSIFLPRKDCRDEFPLTGVRVERLQSISEEDAIAEGIEQIFTPRGPQLWRNYLLHSKAEQWRGIIGFKDPRVSYCSLWESINGLGSWAQNPWVWVLGFPLFREAPCLN